MEIEELTPRLYPEALALMRRTPGIGVREADSPEGGAAYLERNPGFSSVALYEGRVIGCAMCGHDGRRGYLQHVVVDPRHRRTGIAAALVERCLGRLREAGINKCHLDVFSDNEAALAYWARRGWQRRDDLRRFSLVLTGNPDA